MSATHTPGPWSIEKCKCGHPACKQYTISTQGSVGFDEADARLISAAPDLLEALQALSALPEYDGTGTTSKQRLAVKDRVREAIAKATGEAA